MRTLVVGLVVVVVLALAAWFVFVPRPPSPGGPSAVGQAELVLRDALGRSIPVTVWYPAAGRGNGGTPVANAPLDARTPAPLVLYSPGWGVTRMQSRIQVENLASHGFVVVGCDDLASEPTADPDQRANLDVSSDAATAATIERAGRHVVRQAGRLLAVLDALEAGQSTLLAGRLDLTRVGVLGYLRGTYRHLGHVLHLADAPDDCADKPTLRPGQHFHHYRKVSDTDAMKLQYSK